MSTLLSASANATGSTIEYKRPNDDEAWVFAHGTWNSATAKLQFSHDGGTTWFDITDASFTANGFVRVYLPTGHVRGVVSGGGGTESITMELRK